MTNKGWGGQCLQQTSLMKNMVEEVISEKCQIKQKNTALKLGISKEMFVPDGYQEN